MLANIRNTQIYFDVTGMHLVPGNKGLETRPILFLLHGGPGGNHLRYKQHSLELQDVAQLIFIDQRGCGRSKVTKSSEYTLENNIEDLEALRQHLGLERISILGTSYGGVVAQGYAIRYPKKLDQLILVATAPSYRFIDEAKIILKQRGNAKQIKLADQLWAGKFKNPQEVEDFFNIMASLYSVSIAKTKSRIKKKSAFNEIAWSHEAINKGFTETLSHFDFIPELKKIKCPTLILAGQEDWICSKEQSKIMAQHIPHAELKIFRNCGHAIGIDAHNPYIKTIKKFIKNTYQTT